MKRDNPKFLATFERYQPPFITVWVKKNPRALRPAWANLAHRGGRPGAGVLLRPQLHSLFQLAYAVHECAHFWLKHFEPEDADCKLKRVMYTGNHNLTRAQEEYEAEQWTIATLRREGYTITPRLMLKMKDYVSWCIQHDRKEGRHKQPRHVRRFAKIE